MLRWLRSLGDDFEHPEYVHIEWFDAQSVDRSVDLQPRTPIVPLNPSSVLSHNNEAARESIGASTPATCGSNEWNVDDFEECQDLSDRAEICVESVLKLETEEVLKPAAEDYDNVNKRKTLNEMMVELNKKETADRKTFDCHTCCETLPLICKQEAVCNCHCNFCHDCMGKVLYSAFNNSHIKDNRLLPCCPTCRRRLEITAIEEVTDDFHLQSGLYDSDGLPPGVSFFKSGPFLYKDTIDVQCRLKLEVHTGPGSHKNDTFNQELQNGHTNFSERGRNEHPSAKRTLQERKDGAKVRKAQRIRIHEQIKPILGKLFQAYWRHPDVKHFEHTMDAKTDQVTPPPRCVCGKKFNRLSPQERKKLALLKQKKTCEKIKCFLCKENVDLNVARSQMSRTLAQKVGNRFVKRCTAPPRPNKECFVGIANMCTQSGRNLWRRIRGIPQPVGSTKKPDEPQKYVDYILNCMNGNDERIIPKTIVHGSVLDICQDCCEKWKPKGEEEEAHEEETKKKNGG